MSSNQVVNVLGVQVEIDAKVMGNFLKVKGERKAPRPLNMDPKFIRNPQMRNIVQAIRLIREELKNSGLSPKISFCSFQLICAFVSKYLGKPKKYYRNINSSSGLVTSKLMYPQCVYDLAKTIHFLAFEFFF